jgi:signal transduction histidine kinase
MDQAIAPERPVQRMRALTDAFDWSTTPVGVREDWSPALRTAVDLILESNHPMFIWWGPELTQFYNDAYRRTMGPERHPSALGQPGRQCWEEIWPIIGPQIETVLAGGPATWHEDQLVPVTRHGARRDVWWTYGYSALRDQGRIVGVLVVCTDVTNEHLSRRRQARLTEDLRLEAEQRRFEHERQKLMFQQAPGFMCILRGRNHVFEFANDAYRRLVGPRAVIGRPVIEALPEVADQGFLSLLDRVFATGTAYSAYALPVQLQQSPGSPMSKRYLDFVYQPIIEADGTVSGIFVQGSDVTQRYQAEEELRRTNQRKDEFLATLAHELRNPLAPVTAAAQLLLLAQPQDERVTKAAQVIDRQARHMTALVDDLLDASRFSRGHAELRQERLDLGAVLDAALEQVRPQLAVRGHQLHVRRITGDHTLCGDHRRLVQAIANLLANAAKYTPPGGRIEVELEEEAAVWAEPTLRLVVRDNGIGIPAGQQPHIFELFSQAASGPEHAQGGLGIGLALVKAIAGLHGGQVRVRSEGEGRGSEFTLLLPRRPLPVLETAAAVS